MNPITKALDEIKFRIPPKLLALAFKNDGYDYRRAPVSLDEQILNKVIRPRVLIDANLVGGQTVIIPLDGLVSEYVDNFTMVYKIPSERLQRRNIISVINVNYTPYASSFNTGGTGYGSIAPNSVSDVTLAGQRVMDSFSSIPPISTASVSLIANNTIIIKDQFRITQVYQLTCIVDNEENLNNISPRSYLNFAKLCELAVKSFIYRTLIVDIDQAMLSGGQELGVIRTLVESYSDVEDQYQTYLNNTWRKVSFLNDEISKKNFIKRMCNPTV